MPDPHDDYLVSNQRFPYTMSTRLTKFTPDATHRRKPIIKNIYIKKYIYGFYRDSNPPQSAPTAKTVRPRSYQIWHSIYIYRIILLCERMNNFNIKRQSQRVPTVNSKNAWNDIIANRLESPLRKGNAKLHFAYAAGTKFA